LTELSFNLRLVLAVLATYRIARLVVIDVGPFRLLETIRRFCGRMAAKRSPLWITIADGMNCAFCMGEWIAIILLILALKPTFLGDLFLLWQAIAGAQTFVQVISEKEINIEIIKEEIDDA
jgi:hypothetical protein